MRLTRAVRLANHEFKAWRTASAATGGRDGLAARARHHLDMETVDAGRIDGIESSTVELRERLESAEAALARADAQADARAEELTNVTETLGRLGHQLAGLAASLLTLDSVTSLRLRQAERRAQRTEAMQRISVVTDWVARGTVDESRRISIILATRDRAGLLANAVASVRAQSYPNWELIVVDDGSADETPALLERWSAEDERIVPSQGDSRGVSAARNIGISRASGDIICYLDDDNLMEPLWLKAVAWEFGRRPGIEVLYGARLVEPDEIESGSEGRPWIQFEPFDRPQLEEGNYIDLGALAHLRDHPEAHFDEELEALVDWDLVLRLTNSSRPVELPVVACTYLVSAPDRISRSGRFEESSVAVYTTMGRTVPLRVLAYNSLYPLVTETYIGEEVKALTDRGATVAWYTDIPIPTPMALSEPVFTDIDQAVSTFAPDLLFVFWTGFAVAKLEELTRLGLPFALRVHSFDFDPDQVKEVMSHPLCIGVWAYPHHAQQVPGCHELVPLVTTFSDFPEPSAVRTVIASLSAGLPKRNWPLLVGAFSRLADKGADCRIITGITKDFEQEPLRVRELIQASGSPVKLSVDVPHDQVIDLLGRTAAVVYTKTTESIFGMPRSIIEGMLAGTSVIVPDIPEAPLVAGADCRRWRDEDDIVRHVTEILGGGPAVESERLANRSFAWANYADPHLADVFAGQVARALNHWRLSRR